MYWYNLNNAKNRFKKLKDMFRVKLKDFENLSNYKFLVCQPACQPAVRPGSTSARAPDFCQNSLYYRRIHESAVPKKISSLRHASSFNLSILCFLLQYCWQEARNLTEKVLIMSQTKPLVHACTCEHNLAVSLLLLIVYLSGTWTRDLQWIIIVN